MVIDANTHVNILTYMNKINGTNNIFIGSILEICYPQNISNAYLSIDCACICSKKEFRLNVFIPCLIFGIIFGIAMIYTCVRAYLVPIDEPKLSKV